MHICGLHENTPGVSYSYVTAPKGENEWQKFTYSSSGLLTGFARVRVLHLKSRPVPPIPVENTPKKSVKNIKGTE